MINDLSYHLVFKIFQILDIRSLCIVGSLSKHLYVISVSERLWYKKALELGKKNGKLEWKGSWRNTVLGIDDHGAVIRKRHENMEVFQDLKLYKKWYRTHMDLTNFFPADQYNVKRLNAEDAKMVFDEDYDEKRLPVMINNISEFRSMDQWSFERLEAIAANEEFTINCPGKFSVMMKFSAFCNYMFNHEDEKPLYLFDNYFYDKISIRYGIPSFFNIDHFSLIDDENRPRYKWMIIGSARTGSMWHLDPLMTSAWNYLSYGKKRWLMYPPGNMPPNVDFNPHPHPSSQIIDFTTTSPLKWILETLPYLNESEKPLEFIQYPGETVFIPCGWWHSVLNLEPSISFTENFVNDYNIEDVIEILAKGAFDYYKGIYKELFKFKTTFIYHWPMIGCAWLGDFIKKLHYHSQNQNLKDKLWYCCVKHMYGNVFFELLKDICNELQIHNFNKIDACPIVVSSNFILQFNNIITKIYTEKNILRRIFQCTAELNAYTNLNSIFKDNDKITCPLHLSNGIRYFSNDEFNGLEFIPYLVMKEVPGVPLYSKLFKTPNKNSISNQNAQILGDTLFKIHFKNYNIKMHQNYNDDKFEYGNIEELKIWLNDKIINNYYFQAQDPDLIWSNSYKGLLQISSSTELNMDKVINIKRETNDTRYKQWYSFIAYLKFRRKQVINELKDAIEIDLLNEIKQYLPTNIEDLLLTTNNEFINLNPCFLHGDLTLDNVLVSTKNNTTTIGIIDFGDCGYGDPLYDFIAVCISILACQLDLIRNFANAYFKNIYKEPNLLFMFKRNYMISKCLMCLMLLHEDHPLLWIVQKYKDWNNLDVICKEIWSIFDDEIKIIFDNIK